MKKFVHSGALGDIIYGFPIIKYFGGGELYTKKRHAYFFGRLAESTGYISKTDYFQDYYLYTQSKHLANMCMEEPIFNSPTHGEIYNLDAYRNYSRSDFFKYLPQCHADIFDIKDLDFSKPWIENIQPRMIAPIVVNRTDRHVKRYHELNWKVLEPFKDKVIQLGRLGEQELFEKTWGFGFEFRRCEDTLEIAEIIAGSVLHIGNQSLCFAIAEGMKHPRVLEVYVQRPNCGPIGPNAYTALSGELIESKLNDQKEKWEDLSMLIDQPGRTKNPVWNEIVVKDLYFLRRWPYKHFKFIFDIGAHFGIFALAMRFLQPYSKIICLEPGRHQINFLKKNVNFSNVEIIEKAIGNGQDFYFTPNLEFLEGSFCSETSGEYKVPSIKFSDIFKSSGCTLNDNYLIKLDCEGGEKYVLFQDPDAREMLKNASQINMEIHFESKGTKGREWLAWEKYNEMITEIFSNTHDIFYYKSNRVRGYGHFCLTKKGVKFG